MLEIQSELTCNTIAIPGYQGKAGSSPGQPGRAVRVPVHCWGAETDDI